MTDRATSFEAVRRANLGRLLRLVHLGGPQSRAQLTAATGLNRSTIADLVAELVALGVATELPPAPATRAGRPSPVVAAHRSVVAIAVNPEVDALTLAAVGLDGSIVARRRIEVDHLLTPHSTVRMVAGAIDAWRADELRDARIMRLGFAVPGLVQATDGMVRTAPHLRWNDEPLRELATAATGLPAVVGNDASLGAIAEHLFGAGRGIDDMVYLNGGASGIGGGVIVHGMPVAGLSGYAGEFGQNRPGIPSTADRRAGDGVLEDEVSRARLLAVARLTSADEPTLAAALAASDLPDAREEIARQRRILSTALANAVNVLNPRLIVLGGFLATLATLGEGAEEQLLAAVAAQAMPAAVEDLEIRSAALGEDRLLIGAAEAAFAQLLDDPVGSLRAPVDH
ncbi:ROK family protein [Microbacterium sp. LRZ72]|uniref:ROK family protein n=1 Tax=Microbacterium sp. LRZ72 TaxID=2942481 RepID=UPI0029A8DCB6|nr:ROK family protein [Microbacterium sp. LRZ72]MDX2376776.1 ROK family protein [Microbacterium sp. LRZ72]